MQLGRFLRRQITTGTLAPETRLPPTRELARRWRVNNETIGRALAPLTAEGLLVRAPKRGTFVRAATDKALIGVLFGVDLTVENAYFYRAMLNAFRAELDSRDSLCRTFDALFPGRDRDGLRTQAHRNLKDDLSHYRFTGMIEFSVGHEVLPGWPRDATPKQYSRGRGEKENQGSEKGREDVRSREPYGSRISRETGALGTVR
ncbi:MAG: winged helix-turn-helix domain-containing protein, partial [Kiritimatiellae bacterium]|nr:winged helix-turn-helix domain-containing protein [Kiritimatiellia bacterium]